MSILIDAHIHIHPTVNLERLLDAAWNNFHSAQKQLFPDALHCSFVLMLAEGKKNNVFSKLYELAETSAEKQEGAWSFVSTEEEESVIAVRQKRQIVLIAGRQLISSEKLELLSLFSPRIFPDNTYSLNELATLVTNEGGIPLLAWGVGKWLGNRGKVVKQFIQEPPVPQFFVGDNGNRPVFWPYPEILAQAEKQEILSLAGSDPLPITNHEQRAGTYGVGLDGHTLQVEKPASELRQFLFSKKTLIPFGQKANCFQFFKDQVLVNTQKYFGKNSR